MTSNTMELAKALAAPDVLGHPVGVCRLIETHISVVLLTGHFAYKLVKAVQMPFADFRTLAARRQLCERELSLNQRWAASLYLETVPVHGTAHSPSLTRSGPVIEYAIKMRQFQSENCLDHLAAVGRLEAAHCNELAMALATLHHSAPAAEDATPFATPATIRSEVEGNFETLRQVPLTATQSEILSSLLAASERRLQRLKPVFERRRQRRRVRECHGDLHLANIVLHEGKPVPFDGVAFRDDFRWIDVASDLAFLLMDLHRYGLDELAWQVRDGWLTATGDYDALAVLRHYLVYRALVRAKIAALQAGQMAVSDVHQPSGPSGHHSTVHDYLALAQQLSAAASTPALLITHGLSGCGKSVVARALAPALDAIVLRSDVERQRLYPSGEGRYTPSASGATYDHLFRTAAAAIEARYPVILDATFLDRNRREQARAAAAKLGVPFRILDVRAPVNLLEQRIEARLEAAIDPSEANLDVLRAQQRNAEPFSRAEEAVRVEIDGTVQHDGAALAKRLRLHQD